MNHSDHVALLRGGLQSTGGRWADLGSGRGAFTLALADLLGQDGEIWSVDRDGSALREQELAIHARFPSTHIHYLRTDFLSPLPLAQLDGIVMANSLHFLRDREKEQLLAQLHAYLRPGGSLILVEYNADRGNLWVPHPISFTTWKKMSERAGYRETRLLATVPSQFLREIYSAHSNNPSA